jgi:drug/metabolite transporter (DMT)-like permease
MVIGRQLLGVAAAAASSVLGGASVVATRFVIGDTDPLVLALLRYGIGAACLVPIALLIGGRRVARADLPAVALLGALFFALFPTLFNAALAHTTAARGALALSTLPLLTLVVAAALGVEAVTRDKLAGVALAVLGVAVALSGELAAVEGAWRGDLIMVGTALCGAVYNVLSRPYLARYPVLTFTACAMLWGTAALAVTAGAAGALAAPPPAFTPAGWLAVGFLGVFGAALTFVLWSLGLAYATPTLVAITVTLNPVVAMVLGASLLGEPVTARLLLGLAAVAAGVALASRPRQRRQGFAKPSRSGRYGGGRAGEGGGPTTWRANRS